MSEPIRCYDAMSFRRRPEYQGVWRYARKFPYRKLTRAQQQLVNEHVRFHEKVELRATSKHFSTQPALHFYLNGFYNNITIDVTTRTPEMLRELHESSFNPHRYYHQDGLSVRIRGSLDDFNMDDFWIIISLSPDNTIFPYIHFEMSDGNSARYGYRRDQLRLMPDGRVPYDVAHLRIVDKLTANLKSRRIRVDFPMDEQGRPLPIRTHCGLGKLSCFHRDNLFVYPGFPMGTKLTSSSLKMNDWLLDGTRPYQVFLSVLDQSANEYFDFYAAAFDQLLDCQLFRFSFIYFSENECLLSLPIIHKLVLHILNSRKRESGDGRRLIILDTQLAIQVAEDFNIPKSSVNWKSDNEMMLKTLIDELNKISVDCPILDSQLYYGEDDLPLRQMCGLPHYLFSTGIHVLIAQNYPTQTHIVNNEIQWALDSTGTQLANINVRLQWPIDFHTNESKSIFPK
ncbi:unnamed protein product, partial [Mesorhabditis spiculigera]